MRKLNILVAVSLINNYAFSQPLGDRETSIKRVENIKLSTCQILVDKVNTGTGFFVSSDGMIVTNWHVIINQLTKIDSTEKKILSKFSIVNSKNDTIETNILLEISDISIIEEAVVWDYCILKTRKTINTKFLRLGDFSEAYEGASVFTCGFPLEMKVPFISVGVISSFVNEQLNFNSKSYARKIAWLDMTTNKGNSGGALVLLSDKPENDKVIGLTSFMVTPNYSVLENLNKYILENEKHGGVQLMGIDFLQYAKLINSTANSNSVGISGCISIEKVKNRIKKYK